jgi:hypothetical protein
VLALDTLVLVNRHLDSALHAAPSGAATTKGRQYRFDKTQSQARLASKAGVSPLFESAQSESSPEDGVVGR